MIGVIATFGGNANYSVAYLVNTVEIKVSFCVSKITSHCRVSKIQLASAIMFSTVFGKFKPTVIGSCEKQQ